MPTTITDSSNIALLDSKITADFCSGVISVDISPSVFIGTAVENILGANVQIKNLTNGTTVKDYPSTGYDMTPPFETPVLVNFPTIAGTYQYGRYSFTVQLTDEGGKVYEVSKTQEFCPPDGKRKKFGTLSAQLNASCKNGKLFVIADGSPTYGGVVAESQVNAFTLEYPTHSGLTVLASTVSNFSVLLFEGVYIFKGESCVLYALGDNVFAKVKFIYKKEKNIQCSLDMECISSSLIDLVNQMDNGCSDKEKSEIQSKVVKVLLLVKSIETTIQSGFDGSDLIAELEDVLGCVCTCHCNEGTPVNPETVGNDIIIEGCNIDTEVTGLTTTYTINNYEFQTTVVENGGALIISAAVTDGCTKKQTLTLSIPTIYTQIKGQINNTTEYNWWAAIINKQWDGFDVTCLGYTAEQWATMTFRQRSEALFAGACSGGICNSIISANVTRVEGSDAVISWVNKSGVYEVAVYIDGLLTGTVLSTGINTAGEFTAIGFADGLEHSYTLVSKCENGSIGVRLYGDFTYFGCPVIAPPTVSSTNISAACPYNLTALVSVLPPNTTAEWHSQNNTNAQTLVADATQVAGGTYYVFAKNNDGCYSLGVAVTIVCLTGNCTAPQNITALGITDGIRVRFASAAYPPASYTVRRRLATQTDVPGSYTTIGTPTWNATANRWEILDTSALPNKLYVYRAVSNCTSSSPYIDLTFANITCATFTTEVEEVE